MRRGEVITLILTRYAVTLTVTYSSMIAKSDGKHRSGFYLFNIKGGNLYNLQLILHITESGNNFEVKIYKWKSNDCENFRFTKIYQYFFERRHNSETSLIFTKEGELKVEKTKGESLEIENILLGECGSKN